MAGRANPDNTVPDADNPAIIDGTTTEACSTCGSCAGMFTANANDNLQAQQVMGHTGPIIEGDACHENPRRRLLLNISGAPWTPQHQQSLPSTL